MTSTGNGHGSIKEDVVKFLSEQPNDITIEEIMDFLLVKQKIIQGQKALKEGHYYSHEKAKELMKKWLQ